MSVYECFFSDGTILLNFNPEKEMFLRSLGRRLVQRLNIGGRSGRWRRRTRTCSSPSSTGWRRRRRRGRSTWWGEAGQRSRPLCIGFEGCNRSEDHLHLRWSLLIIVLSVLTSQDDDPCLVSTMTESLLPFLPGELFMLISLSLAYQVTFCFFSFLTRRSFHVNLVWHVRYCAFDKVFLFLIWNWIFLRTERHWGKAAILPTAGHPGNPCSSR